MTAPAVPVPEEERPKVAWLDGEPISWLPGLPVGSRYRITVDGPEQERGNEPSPERSDVWQAAVVVVAWPDGSAPTLPAAPTTPDIADERVRYGAVIAEWRAEADENEEACRSEYVTRQLRECADRLEREIR